MKEENKALGIVVNTIASNVALSVWDGEFHPCPNSFSLATKSEPNDEATSHRAIPLFNYVAVLT